MMQLAGRWNGRGIVSAEDERVAHLRAHGYVEVPYALLERFAFIGCSSCMVNGRAFIFADSLGESAGVVSVLAGDFAQLSSADATALVLAFADVKYKEVADARAYVSASTPAALDESAEHA